MRTVSNDVVQFIDTPTHIIDTISNVPFRNRVKMTMWQVTFDHIQKCNKNKVKCTNEFHILTDEKGDELPVGEVE